MEKELIEARKAIAMLLDHAVYDCEVNDKCIDAVEFARNVLRSRPNKETISAMEEAQA